MTGLQSLCASMQAAARERQTEAARKGAAERREAMAALAGVPVDEIEWLLPRVARDRAARERVIALIETLDCDDPRKNHYRKELSRRLF